MNALTFDFISDGPFRDSLISDYREMTICVESGSWKAVHVLAGSVVEALLIEYLVVSKLRPKGIDPHKIDLATAIEACVAEGVIKPSTASLCEVIRDYRKFDSPRAGHSTRTRSYSRGRSNSG
jgi:hypothetical protein